MKIVGIYKKSYLSFKSTQGSFFLLFCFTMYKMVDNECNIDIYISVKIIIGTVVRNSEMLKFVPVPKLKKMFKNAVKNYHL